MAGWPAGSTMGDMDETNPKSPQPKASLSDYLAAERTLLAWIRTGITLMGFGFVVARFGLFLRALSAMGNLPLRPGIGSPWIGSTLVALGVAVNLYGTVAHWRRVKQMKSGGELDISPFSGGSILAIILGLFGIGLMIYLLSF